MKPALVVLAAGMGSRYGGLKQIDPVGPNGESILDYSIFDAIRAGFGKVVFVIKRDLESIFKEKIGCKYKKLIEVEYVFQEIDSLPDNFSVPAERKKPWGTGHAILTAESAVKEPFAVINADDFYGLEAFEVMADKLSNQKNDSKEFFMAAYFLKNTLSDHGHVSRGICSLDKNYLSSVTERENINRKGKSVYYSENSKQFELAEDSLVSMNFWGFTPVVFSILKERFINFLSEDESLEKREFYIPFVIDHAIKNNLASVEVLETKEQWFGMTYPEDKEIVVDKIKKSISDNTYPDKLYN